MDSRIYEINYLFQIRAFYEWMERNELSSGAIALWHALMYLWNQSFWKEEFTPAMNSIVARSGMSRASVFKYRKELCESGLLEIFERGGRQLTCYKLVPFEVNFKTLYKQNKTKQNKTKKSSSLSSSCSRADEQIEAYNRLCEILGSGVR